MTEQTIDIASSIGILNQNFAENNELNRVESEFSKRETRNSLLVLISQQITEIRHDHSTLTFLRKHCQLTKCASAAGEWNERVYLRSGLKMEGWVNDFK
jgi:hypothetical protein